MASFNSVIKELEKFSPSVIDLGESITDNRLVKFEEKYKLKLPQDYKLLISKFNGIELMGDVIYGVYGEDVESLTSVYYREHFLVKVPQHSYFVPFSPDGGGNFYCFDTRTLRDDSISCPIVFWESNVIYEGEPEVVADSFIEWVNEVFIGWPLEQFNYDGSRK